MIEHGWVHKLNVRMRHLIFDCIQFGRAHTQTNTDIHGSSRFTAIVLCMFIIMHEGMDTQTVITSETQRCRQKLLMSQQETHALFQS